MFKGQIAVITGGAGSIGKDTAERFIKNGIKGIILADFDKDRVETVAREISVGSDTQCYGIELDVSKEESVKAVFKFAVETFGKVDILINCAGICPRTPLADEDALEWERVMRINITGVHLCCREALPIMKKNQYGRIVSISSIAAHIGTAASSISYAASKAAIHGASRSYAKLVYKDNVTVNMVCPSVVVSNMSKDGGYNPDEHPMGRLAYPEDISPAVVFLASKEAAYINGVALDINGGSYFAN